MIDFEIKYNHLAKLTNDYFKTKEDYYKSGKSPQERDNELFRKSKAIETNIKNLINGKPKPQASLFNEEFLCR